MNKLCLMFVAVAASIVAIAEPRTISEIMKLPVSELTPEEHQLRTAHVRRAKLRIFGEEVVKPRSQKGMISVINAQDKLAAEDIGKAIDVLSKATKLKIEQEVSRIDGCPIEFASQVDKTDRVVLLVVANDKLPPMLIAPEARWAIVNVAKLDEGVPSGVLYQSMFTARCRKEILRAFSLLCGGGSSQFQLNVTDAATWEDLDSVQEFLPVDMEQRFTPYLSKLGIRPAYVRNYKQACIEGWAPAPTNEIQQAIWDKIHEVPTKGLEIKFDPKKGK